MTEALQTLHVDNLRVHILPDRDALGKAAADAVVRSAQNLLAKQPTVAIIFAAAPSQNELLDNLAWTELPWSRVVGFHMDEYLGLPPNAPQRFATFLRQRLFDRVNLNAVHYINSSPADISAECLRYSQLLRDHPPDIICLGIGENGHIAFNEPYTSDFADSEWARVVELNEASRQQQVHDGAFTSLEQVPRRAITLTVPALMTARKLVCVVPGPRKVDAVYRTLVEPVSPACPASILRTHNDAELFLDENSARLLKGVLVQ